MRNSGASRSVLKWINNILFPNLFVSDQEKVTEQYFFLRRNFVGQFGSAILMLIVDAFWLIMDLFIKPGSRGLVNDPVPLSGIIIHISLCVFFIILAPFIFKKTNNEKFLRFSALLLYLATIYAVCTINISKNVMLVNNGVNASSADIGISLISLYYIILCFLPFYNTADSVICGIAMLACTIVPRFVIGNESYSLLSYLVLLGCNFVQYEFFKGSISKEWRTAMEAIARKEEEETKHLAVINALGDEFDEVLHLDLRKNRAEQFRNDRNIEKENYNANETYEYNLHHNLLPAVVDEDRETVARQLSRAYIVNQFDQCKKYFVGFKINHEGGEPEYYQAKIIRDENESEEVAIIGLRNVNEQIKQEKLYAEQLKRAKDDAEKASKAKSVFLFNMSHDIRTPMNAIMGYIELAKKYEDNKERLDDCLGKMSISSEHLLNLINDVLDMARIESGKVTIDENPTDIKKFASDLTNMFVTSAQQKGIEFTTSSDVKHQYVFLDTLRCNQVVLNLTSNATKYTKTGGKIHASLDEIDCDRKGYARFKFVVEDTGIGMTPEFLEHIFESFSRATDATHSGVQGTGLGMAITKNLIDLMGGHINIESEVGKGTKVTVIIDLRLTEEIQEETKEEGEFNIEGMKVLVVEDNELNREIAKEILLDFGAVVSEANDGDVAVGMIKNSHKGDYDIVLMDIQMPMMNGYQATQAIRGLKNHEMNNIPIVAMTANAFEEDKQNALKAGMNGHLGKPIDLQELKNTLQFYFKK